MGVAVGVDVRGHAAEQTMELVELPVKLVAHQRQIPEVKLTLILAPDVPVQPDGQSRLVAAHGNRLGDSSARDHEARAGEYAAGVTLQDAAVDAGRGAEIVGIEDEEFGHRL